MEDVCEMKVKDIETKDEGYHTYMTEDEGWRVRNAGEGCEEMGRDCRTLKRVKTKDFEEGMKNIGLMIESMRVTMKKKKKNGINDEK